MALKSSSKVSPIDARLASQHHLRQIEALIRVERIADRVTDVFRIAENQLMGVVVSDNTPATVRRFAGSIYDAAFREVQNKLYAEFQPLAYWSHKTAVESLAKAVPRNYFRLASPLLASYEAVGMEGEADDVLAAFIRQIVGNLIIDNFTEPVARSKIRILSNAAWLRVLDEVIFPTPPKDRILDLINAVDAQNRNWQDRLLVLSRKVTDVEKVAEEIAIGYADGEQPAALRKRVLPLTNNIVSSTKRIVRTEGLRIAERLQRETWGPLGDMMIGVQILAVLDENTRAHHVLRNGSVYFRTPQPGQLSMFTDLPLLPDEPNCRCWSTPVLRPPKDLENDPLLKAAFSNADGSGVPDPATYEQWFTQADPTRRKLAVGVRRYGVMVKKLAGAREPEWSDFVDPKDGRLMATARIQSEGALARILRKERVADLIRERQSRIADIANAGFTYQ